MRSSSSVVLRGFVGGALALACLAGAGFASTSARADDAACKALEAAMIANTKTPFHSYAKITFDYAAMMTVAQRNMKLPEAQQSETIFTGQAVYVRLMPGKWKTLPGTLAQFQDAVKASFSTLSNCQKLADDKVDGVAASVYQGDTTPQHRLVQTKVWISAQGVPVKSETDIEIGHSPGGNMVHQHLSTRYEYGNIQAPSLTQ